jgi:serine/threonine-protein kinase
MTENDGKKNGLKRGLFARFELLFKMVVLAAAFMFATGLSAFVIFTFLTRGGDVEVPNLTGQEIRAALELASRSELGLTISGTGHDPSIPPGHIVSQDPDPGVRIRKNRIVRVTVSQGTPTVLVPDLTGLTARRARLQLTQSGLRMGSISRSHVRHARLDAIVTQTPHPGILVPRDTEVDLLISEGRLPITYVLPDMTGLPVEEVMDSMRRWGLTSGQISETENEHLPPGTVVVHEPGPGMHILEGQVVNLTVSAMPRPTLEMPIFFYPYEAVGLLDRELKFVLVRGSESTILHQELVPAGASVNIPISVTYPGILEVYEDGYLIEERAVP